MKKYIIIFSLFVVLFAGLLLAQNILDKDSDTNAVQQSQNGEYETSDLGEVQGSETVLEMSNADKVIANPEGDTTNQYSIIIDAKLGEEDWQKRQQAGITNESIVKAMEECKGLYAYEKIDIDLKQLYAELLLVMQNRASDISLCCIDSEKIEYVSSCVMLDHPEIFYVEGYAYEKYMFAGKVQKITYQPNYTMSEADVIQIKQSIEQYEEACFKGISKTASDYEKVKYIYEFVILNTEYKLDVPENQNICSVFIYRESVCLGYAKAVQYLLQKLDVEATIVTGNVISGEGHAWNLVKINGQYYYVDATWGDASYLTDSGVDALSAINYDYLCITTADLEKTHIIDNPVQVPNCIVRIDNYYVKEGLLFNSLDSVKIERIFNEAQSDGKDCVSIRCENEDVFQMFQTNMLDNQQIFQYLGSGTTTLAYTTNDKLYTYTFML